MAALDVFLPAIRKHISGPLDLMMRQSVLEAAITFCRESLFCRDSLTLTDVVPGVTHVLTESEQVKCVKRLRVKDYSVSNANAKGHTLVSGIDFTVISANHLAFNHAFAQVEIIFAVEPRRNASVVPDVLADDYMDVIVAGALEDLYLMPGRPWSDPQRAQYFRTLFIDGYRRAYRDALNNSHETGFHNPVRRHEFY
ncbi:MULTISPECIES: hypothetical protein [unclassified Brenneria]|uniref:hypothetical protein n=1 Tax=unclassified Brenneria TaxID=2634434 RepID=UPI001552A48B|nr:hypothetical protein [Brenneria sp. hezel4-2-4]MEE3649457.1 hypothetical protein [Brenneria sp. HEZEL_4_2_4]NPC99413.1 hypothetical protein [Brenneria sp. hezel4-2-4]